ncbi:MAG: S-layer homology domain-containing protein [Oscillospiraceae bacterium]|nr:S-layer homology domain-containing protein [Oscillospiraceae bacterium]
MHRFTAFLLTAALLSALCVPAMAAEETADARLKRVTQAVKDTLDLDTEAYTDFYGDVYEQELGKVWTLRWSGNGSNLNIEALEDGTIVNYYRSDAEPESVYYGNTLPVLPKADAAKAKVAAEAFLKKVLDAKTESVKLGEPISTAQLNSTVTRFNGRILLNGLPSPLNYSIAVRGSDSAVTSFYRDALATSFLGNVPSAKPAVAKDAAAKTLKDTLKLELIYVTDENDAAKAVLRYVPKDYQEQYVDAQTGKLVAPDGDMTLYGTNASAAPEEADMDAGGGSKRALTQAELTGIEKLEGVLDSAALDKAIRAERAYKLDGFSLSRVNYRLVKENDAERVLCSIQYAAPEDKDGYIPARSFTVDARSGKVESLYSYGIAWDKDIASKVTAAAAQSGAEAFLKRFTDRASEFALYSTEDRTADGAPSYGFTFARKVNGYFFPANACTVQIDRVSGAVVGVSYAYDEKLAFDSPDGIITEAAALDAWMDTYDVTLAYRSQPKALSKAVPAEAKLIDIGYRSFRTLLLSYGLEREGYIPGIDAKTGKPVELPRADGKLAYSDVAKHWAAQEINALAECGVGYAAEEFRPNKQLTQWELVALIASSRGYCIDVDNAAAEERDTVYKLAYRMGALTSGERADDALVTRGDAVKMLLNAAGYGPVARLGGIFTCSFRDRAAIPAADLGYAALSQGFGVVTTGSYNASGVMTRAVAAVMLYRLMQREA